MAQRLAAASWDSESFAFMRTTLGTPENCLRVVVVGSGPAGFYAAEALLHAGLAVEVDVLERLPVPYGLVRFGVAPDHPKLKAVTTAFAGIAKDERTRYCGNVALARDVSVDELAAMYHAVVIATGADGEQLLNIEGENLDGVHAARDFVGWYNGHPEYASLSFDLSGEIAAIIGQGNVAIDVCRILAKPVDELRRTDIAEHALDTLARSRVRQIRIIGRRGPVQAKFTPKELRELGSLPGWRPVIDPAALQFNEASRVELQKPTATNEQKNVAILKAFAGRPLEGNRPIYLDFQQAPVALNGGDRLRHVILERQRLEGGPMAQVASPTGERSALPVDLLFRSVGYRGTDICGLPFDERRGVIRNREGRIVDGSGERLLRMYATGWIKRGCTGIIGTNRMCSDETIARLIEDLPRLEAPRPGRSALSEKLHLMGQKVVSFDDWLAIERAEVDRGRARQKVAEKFVRVGDMLGVIFPPPDVGGSAGIERTTCCD